MLIYYLSESEIERPQDACEPHCECPEGFQGVQPFCQPVNTEDIAPPVEDIGEVAPTVEDVAPPGEGPRGVLVSISYASPQVSMQAFWGRGLKCSPRRTTPLL